jgi:hypothetical protein
MPYVSHLAYPQCFPLLTLYIALGKAQRKRELKKVKKSDDLCTTDPLINDWIYFACILEQGDSENCTRSWTCEKGYR